MIFTTNNTNYLIYGNRVFLSSKNINIFPCARRGPYSKADTTEYYDPEARLNTERTNRIGTAINGFTDQFIITEPSNLTRTGLFEFVLAGYRVSIKDFRVLDIEAALLGPDPAEGTTIDTIYAHLSLHPSVSLNVEGYATEILYRQIQSGKYTNYLDITDPETAASTDDFFVGISFTREPVTDGNGTEQDHDLLLFSKDEAGSWQFVQASILPKISHGDTKDSIKVHGDLVVEHTLENGETQTSFKVTKDEMSLGKTVIADLTVTDSATINSVLTASNGIELTAGNIQVAKDSKITVAKTGGTATTIGDYISTDGRLSVGKYINVGSLTDAERTSTSGDIVAKNNISALNAIKAPQMYQTIEGAEKQVPFIDIVEQSSGQWQLQINRAGKYSK